MGRRYSVSEGDKNSMMRYMRRYHELSRKVMMNRKSNNDSDEELPPQCQQVPKKSVKKMLGSKARVPCPSPAAIDKESIR